MHDNSFTSLIILLVLFFVLPSVFKLLGQYTLKSKGLDRQGHEDEESEVPMPRETIPGHPEKIEPMRGPREENSQRAMDNTPIHPRWF
jgi:hypothetical protein